MRKNKIKEFIIEMTFMCGIVAFIAMIVCSAIIALVDFHVELNAGIVVLLIMFVVVLIERLVTIGNKMIEQLTEDGE